MSCAKGGFPSIRHNEIRDLTATVLTKVCNDVCTEPELQPVTDEELIGATANSQPGARLDIAANGVWGGTFERTYFDIRVFTIPMPPSNRHTDLQSVYRKHEQIKKRAYEQQIREVEHATFSPLVLSAIGGLAREANIFYTIFSTRDWSPCSPPSGITPTAALYAGSVAVYPPFCDPLFRPSEAPDHHVEAPSGCQWWSTWSTLSLICHQHKTPKHSFTYYPVLYLILSIATFYHFYL